MKNQRPRHAESETQHSLKCMCRQTSPTRRPSSDRTKHPSYFAAPLFRGRVSAAAGSSSWLARPFASSAALLASRGSPSFRRNSQTIRCTDDTTHDLGRRRKLDRLVLLSLPVGRGCAAPGEHCRRTRLQSRGAGGLRTTRLRTEHSRDSAVVECGGPRCGRALVAALTLNLPGPRG